MEGHLLHVTYVRIRGFPNWIYAKATRLPAAGPMASCDMTYVLLLSYRNFTSYNHIVSPDKGANVTCWGLNNMAAIFLSMR